MKLQLKYDYTISTEVLLKLQNRKRRVLLSAQKLFIEKGFHATSIQDILDESNISKGTFYNYFASKNECLIAILESAQNDTIVRRAKLQENHSITDKHVLEKQISVPFEVTRKQNLLPLFEAIRHSDDEELRQFVKRYHFQEMKWLASRLVDVYGKEAQHYAFDCAIIFLGIIQQLLHFWGTYTDKEIQLEVIISFAMRRIDKIINDLIKTNDILFGDKLIKMINHHTDSHQQLIQALLQFNFGNNHKAKEYVQFIVDELKSNKLRKHILLSVLLALRHEILDAQIEIDSLIVLSKIEQYVEHHSK